MKYAMTVTEHTLHVFLMRSFLYCFFYYNITSKIWNEFKALVCFEMHFAPFDIFSTWKLIFLVKWNYLGTKKVRIVELLVFSFKVSLLLSIFILNNVHMKMHWIFNQYYIKIHYNLTIDTLWKKDIYCKALLMSFMYDSKQNFIWTNRQHFINRSYG